MTTHRKARRILAGGLVVGGALLMFLAPDSRGGLGLLVAGIAIELIGIVLEHKG